MTIKTRLENRLEEAEIRLDLAKAEDCFDQDIKIGYWLGRLESYLELLNAIDPEDDNLLTPFHKDFEDSLLHDQDERERI